MKGSSPLSLVLAFLTLVVPGTSLFSQSTDSNAVSQGQFAVNTLIKYCRAIDTFSETQQPRMFARVGSSYGPWSGWSEFENKAAWRSAGDPKPLALVWSRDSNIVRVVIGDGPRDDARSYTEYCYRRDGSLAEIMPSVGTKCDSSLLRCVKKGRAGKVYPPKGMVGVLPVRIHKEERPEVVYPGSDFYVYDIGFPEMLQAERETLIDIAPDLPEYLTVWDLPFNRLLSASNQ